MRLTDEALQALAHQTMKGFELVKTLATEVLESRAALARLVAEVADAQLSEAHANQSCIRGNLTIHALTDRVAELTKERDAAIADLGYWARKAGALEARAALGRDET